MRYLKKRKEIDKGIVSLLESATGLRREVCEVLAMRGIDTEEKAQEFLRPFINNLTPVTAYAGMREAADRIRQAIEYGEKVVIYGDYDCDGVCATVILYLLLSSEGVDVDYYIPVRKKEGYGINREALEEIAEEYCPDLIISVDCGITASEDIDYAMEELGIDVIVTDHHEPPEILPQCIVLDPKTQSGEEGVFTELCGAGVVLRLCEAIGGVNAMMYYIDIAALATIADVVPLLGDNRIIVNYGIDIINARARQSMKLLLDLSYPSEPNRVLTSADIAYKIVPKINAVGRLADSRKAVEMFIDDDYFYAKSLVNQAIDYNQERQKLTEELIKQCHYMLEEYDLINNRVIVLYGDKWETGVLGIAAAKIAEEFRRPAILLTLSDGIYKGSCRSIEGVNLYDTLKACSSYLVNYGGHAMACGVGIERENIEGFILAMNECLYNKRDCFLPQYTYDIEINSPGADLKLIEDMSVLEPFGAGNSAVKYLIKGSDFDYSRVGGAHLKINVNSECELMCFNGAAKSGLLSVKEEKGIIAEISDSVFNNRRYAQGIVSDIVMDLRNISSGAEYYAVRHLYQVKYEDKSIFDIATATDGDIDKWLNKDIYGTCFLCYNKDTYNAFSEKYYDKLVVEDIDVLSGINPYNRLIMDINISENLSYYKRIVFLDAPLRRGLVDMLRLNRNAEVYMHIDAAAGVERSKALVAGDFPQIDEMRDVFKEIRGVLNSRKVHTFRELYSFVEGKVSVVRFYIAMFTFYEIGLIGYKGALVINNVKVNPNDSAIYKGIAEEIAKLVN